MRLNLSEPLLYWEFNPFDEITIPTREGILIVFLRAVVGENAFFGIITESNDLLQQKGLPVNTLVKGEIFEDYILIQKSDSSP